MYEHKSRIHLIWWLVLFFRAKAEVGDAAPLPNELFKGILGQNSGSSILSVFILITRVGLSFILKYVAGNQVISLSWNSASYPASVLFDECLDLVPCDGSKFSCDNDLKSIKASGQTPIILLLSLILLLCNLVFGKSIFSIWGGFRLRGLQVLF